MNTILLIFFALPLAVIIISIVLQKILKCPFLVAGLIFAIFLIVTFVVGIIELLIATIIYTILSFITALIVALIERFFRNCNNNDDDCCHCRRNCRCCNEFNCDSKQEENNGNELLTISSTCGNMRNGNLLTISSNCSNGSDTTTNDLLTVGTTLNNNGNNCWNNQNNNCGCGNQNNVISSNGVLARINFIPNSNTNGNTGCVCGSYRRR